MSALCRGSALRSWTRPRLPGATRVISTDRARKDGSVRPKFWYGTGRTCHWMSGAGSAGSVRVNPPASATLVASGPAWVSCHRARLRGPACSHSPRVRGVLHMAGTTGWSDRFAPDAGAVGHHRDVVLAQVVGRTDAGQHQQLRAADGARRPG